MRSRCDLERVCFLSTGESISAARAAVALLEPGVAARQEGSGFRLVRGRSMSCMKGAE